MKRAGGLLCIGLCIAAATSIVNGQNHTPTLTVQPTSVTITQGQILTVVATATDLDGDDLVFVWTGLNNTTINPPFVSSQRISSTQWRSTLNYPTAAIASGSYQFRVLAFEDKPEPLSSEVRAISVVVTAAAPPQARIRYRLEPSGSYITPGVSVQTSARTIYLDATASTGEGTLSFAWSVTGLGATLSSGSAPQVTLSIPQGATGAVTVSLTATDQENRSHSTSLLFNLAQVPTQPDTVLNFSQVAVGRIDSQRRFETSVVLINDSDDVEAFGVMDFTNALGGDWVILIDGEPVEKLSFTIIPGGAREFTLRGEEIEFGWMSVTSNIPLVGHLFYRVVDQNDRILREVPILPVWGYSFRTALGAGAHEFVAVALVNLGENTTRFRIVAREDTAPDSPYPTRWIELAPGQHLAHYLSEIYQDHAVIGAFPPGFLGGSLIVEIDDPSGRLGATIIRTTEDGLPLSILPVAARR